MGNAPGDLSEGNGLKVMIARLDERVQAMQRDLGEMRDECVTKAEFRPVQKIVYGLVGTATLALLIALLSLVLR